MSQDKTKTGFWDSPPFCSFSVTLFFSLVKILSVPTAHYILFYFCASFQVIFKPLEFPVFHVPYAPNLLVLHLLVLKSTYSMKPSLVFSSPAGNQLSFSELLSIVAASASTPVFCLKLLFLFMSYYPCQIGSGVRTRSTNELSLCSLQH